MDTDEIMNPTPPPLDPDAAAAWMRRAVIEKGLLLQRDAASFLSASNDEKLAYVDDTGCFCVGKPTLKRFRKLCPDLVYDRHLKGWRTGGSYEKHPNQKQTRSAVKSRTNGLEA